MISVFLSVRAAIHVNILRFAWHYDVYNSMFCSEDEVCSYHISFTGNHKKIPLDYGLWRNNIS